MAPIPSFMRLRNRTWHYRRRVPTDLRGHFDDLYEFTKSCHSSKAGDARVLRAQFDRELDLIFLSLRAKLMTPELARTRIDELFCTQKFKATSAPPPFISADDLVGGMKCSAVIVLCEQMNSPNWSPKTRAEKKSIYTIINKRFGQKTMMAIKVADVLSWREELMRSFGVVTVNKYLSNLSGIFRFAIQHEYATSNPTSGLQLKDDRLESEVRKAYSETDIVAIFRALIAIKKECYQMDRHERFWIPLIAMYSGLRVEECAQLDIGDIDLNDCFIRVTPAGAAGDKKVKNKSSIRDVPIHADLLTLGLGVYVKNTDHAGKKKLFPHLQRHKLNGYSHEFIKWWGRWGRGLVPDLQKTFHSFRHYVADRLKQAGTDGYMISEILGHKIENISLSRYGKQYGVDSKLKAMECLSTGFVKQITELELTDIVNDGETFKQLSWRVTEGSKVKIRSRNGTFPFVCDSPYVNYLDAYYRPDWYGFQFLHKHAFPDLWCEEILFELHQDVLERQDVTLSTS